jgi:molecular chaperone GrpE
MNNPRPNPEPETSHDVPAPNPGGADDALRQRVEAAERQRDEYLQLLRQTQADFENARQRAARERDAERKYYDLLHALDNLDRAIATAKQAGQNDPLVQGVALAQSQILDAFKRHGIRPIDAQDKPFDPNLHEAVMQQPSSAHPANTVLHVLEQGYLIHDRVLRPSRVIVSTTEHLPM